MPLTKQSIELIKDVPITKVVGHFLKLNSKGQAPCPFHNEKTASFKATDSKEIYKCFGCGASGDGIAFVMNHENKTFIEAVEIIADITGITLVQEPVANKEEYERQKKQKDTLKIVLNDAVLFYKKHLWDLPAEHPVKEYLATRGLDKDVMAEWHLGWAGEDWRTITPGIIEKGNFAAGESLGLVKRSKQGDQNYDGYRSRILFPIQNPAGEFIGIGGRFFILDQNDNGKEYPKYINPPDNDIYNKSKVLYGLNRATRAMKETGFCYLVEGYTDVISMHTNGEANTVATCGTALTSGQAALLKKYTAHVVVLRDGDKAGTTAAKRDIPILLKAGFKVDVAIMPSGQDPDSFIHNLGDTQKGLGIKALINIQDAINWMVAGFLDEAGEDPFKKGVARQQTIELVAQVQNEMVRVVYMDQLQKKNRWDKKEVSKQLNKFVSDSDGEVDMDESESMRERMPKWMDKDEFMKNGYCQISTKNRTGYYTLNAGGEVEITNFVINPLFHVSAGKESRHLIQIDNGVDKAVLDVESAALVSIDLLQKYIVHKGAFIIYGNKLQMLRVATNLLKKFPMCFEINFLGWQSYGFFAFVDKIYVPGEGFQDLNEWGITKQGDTNYLVPAASAAYKELQGHGDDPYENDRVLKYMKPGLTFEQWATAMDRVYYEKGPVAIAFTFVTVFRDIIFSIDNNCPHLYGFGERSAGKSKWAESIAAFFYDSRAAFNLNSGTDFAFFSYMQRFQNCASHLNEFDEKVIKPEWFQAIKGIFDGEGRQRGVAGSKNRTEIMKIKSTLILTGQFLCTMDDNSIVSRSIIEGFNEREVSQEDKQAYDHLKDQEKTGLSGLLAEVLKYRNEFKAIYQDRFNATLSRWRKSMGIDGAQINQRIMQNWCHLYASYEVMGKYLKLPGELEMFEKYCINKAIYWSAFIRASDTLSEFWNTFSFLIDTGILINGWDYKIVSETQIRVRKDRKDETIQDFPEATKIIYIRMNTVHKHYQQAYRQRTGKEGMTLENLTHYFSSRKYFLGSNKQSRFNKWVQRIEGKTQNVQGHNITSGEYQKVNESITTSSVMFLYEGLGIDIERTPDEGEPFANKPDNQSLPFPD